MLHLKFWEDRLASPHTPMAFELAPGLLRLLLTGKKSGKTTTLLNVLSSSET
jgi:hypothetical protein